MLQRLGFSIADSWRQAGFNVNARQVDNGEFGTVQTTNSKFTMMVNWSNTCVYNANWLNTWRVFKPDNVKDVNSSDPLNGNARSPSSTRPDPNRRRAAIRVACPH